MGAGISATADAVGQQQSARCFLCHYADHPCDVEMVEGRILRVFPGEPRGRLPALLLDAQEIGEIAITLPDHTRPLCQQLAGLSPDLLRGLHARVFHLLRGTPPADGEARRPHLRSTPASVLVLEPDLLLNITDINNAEYCARQYPLRRMAPSPPTAATLRGTLIHTAFKSLLRGDISEDPDTLLERAMGNTLHDLALRGIAPDVLAAEAAPHMESLANWLAGQRGNLWGAKPDVRAETFLLAPEVGLKGRLDFLMRDTRGDALLELKTGAVRSDLPKREHRWQVYGYQTLLSVRRPADASRPGATLLYSGLPGTADSYGVPFGLRELHRVLDLRNRLALIHATGAVPDPPGGKCDRCMLRHTCLRASLLHGWVPPPSDEVPEVGLRDDAGWFARYAELLRQEARAAEQQAATLWTLSAEQRCAAGIALGGLEPLGEPEQTPNGEWQYTFACDNTSELREGDEILLSDGDPVRGAVVSGTILRLTDRGATVWTRERIANPCLLDRYASDIVHDRTVRNLWRWLDADARLKALVSGDRRPEFDPVSTLDDLPPDVNAEQRDAIQRALAARDYLLVQGPPGTGKTRVVAEIAQRAVARGERVLVAAFTNQAVDNVLRRLVRDGFTDFVRLGHELSVAPELHSYRLAERAQRLASAGAEGGAAFNPAALREALLRAPLVATTTATWSADRYDDAGEPLDFDLAIVDEASQLTVPAILGALRFVKRFILVGDERQLPPLVVSAEASERGLGRSLFAELLSRWGEVASVALRAQYRMHPLICGFPSQEFYDGLLIAAGTAQTALLDLAIDAADPHWSILDPDRPLVFIDVPEGVAGKASLAQAEVVRALVLTLRRNGVAAEDIGVVAPYRAQVAAIRQRLAARGEGNVTVDTVDRFQGGERLVMLCSFGGRVEERIGARGLDFLTDPHRLNVGLTRAQRKLIMVGDRAWLTRAPRFARLVDYCASLYGGRGGVARAAVRTARLGV